MLPTGVVNTVLLGIPHCSQTILMTVVRKQTNDCFEVQIWTRLVNRLLEPRYGESKSVICGPLGFEVARGRVLGADQKESGLRG